LPSRPPRRVVEAVELFAPGFWSAFVYFINDAVASVSAPVTLTSWYRNEADNYRVGGHNDSQHLIGAAVDLHAGTPGKLIEELTRRGFIVVDEGDHIHVQAWPAGLARRAGLLDYLGY